MATAAAQGSGLAAVVPALRIVTSLVLFARGWLTWRWDSPLRGLVWKEDWWSSLLQGRFGIRWSEFAVRSDAGITAALEVVGLLLMALALVPWLALWRPLRGLVHLLWLATLILVVDAFARWVAVDYEFAMSIEHALQVITPLALWSALRYPQAEGTWRTGVSICAALTFVGHGLYACGVHPVPLVFQTMTQKILSVGPQGTTAFLLAAGIFDFLAAAGLWFRKLRRPALLYMMAWGFVTALARPVAHGASDPWIAEMLVRTPHWLLPWVLWCVVKERRLHRAENVRA